MPNKVFFVIFLANVDKNILVCIGYKNIITIEVEGGSVF